MKKRPYIIWTPSMSPSNGVRVLHLLADMLMTQGFDVMLYSAKPYQDKYTYIETVSPSLQAEAVVVYPEIVHGNPLQVRRVVRYVLYYPGKLGGSAVYFPDDRVFTYQSVFFPGVPVLTIPWIDTTLFYNDNKEKTEDCFFVHKGGHWREVPEICGFTKITMDYPKNRPELAALLRRTRVLYSFDDCSAVLDEAAYCGATVYVITPTGTIPYQSSYGKILETVDSQFSDFVEHTQAMPASHSCEPFVPKSWTERLAYHLKKIVYSYVFFNRQVGDQLENQWRGFN